MCLILPILNHVCNINKTGDCRLAALEDAEQKLNTLTANTEEALAQLRALPALIATR